MYLLWSMLFLVFCRGFIHEIPGQQPQIGNGYLASFVNASSIFLAGVFSGPSTNSTRAAVPNVVRVNIFPKRNSDQLDCFNTSAFSLNLSSATVLLNGICTSGSSSDPILYWTQRWYAPRNLKVFSVSELFVYNNPLANALKTFKVPVVDHADDAAMRAAADPQDPQGISLMRKFVLPYASGGKTPAATQTTEAANGTCYIYRTNQPEYINVPLTYVAVARTFLPEELVIPPSFSSPNLSDLSQNSELLALRVLGMYLRTTNATSEWDEVDTTMILSEFVDSSLWTLHVQAWRELWDHAVFTDSLSSSAPLISSQYAIMSAIRADEPFSTSPGGLATQGYEGHTFWDMSTWVNPNMMLFHPDIALGSGFRYRLDRLLGAQDNAAATLGITGNPTSDGNVTPAAFPWESAFTGKNVCPAPVFAQTELHVTADVVLAIELYYHLTKNSTFLSESWDTLISTALFWVYRTTALEGGGNVHLNNVTGPDEYHLGNDSVYTNYAVQRAVAFTLEAAQILGKSPNNIPEFDAMQRISQSMNILYSSSLNFHPEFSSWNDTMQAKQADVILLNYPLGMPEYSDSTVKTDLDYYAQRTNPNPSGASTMTWTMYSIGYLSLGDFTNGMYYFNKGYQNNCFPPYWQWYQHQNAVNGGNDNFISGAGGFVQNFWAGFAALRVSSQGLELRPRNVFLPEDASFLLLKGVIFRGCTIDFRFEKALNVTTENSTINLTLQQTSSTETSEALCVFTDGYSGRRSGWASQTAPQMFQPLLTGSPIMLSLNTFSLNSVIGVTPCQSPSVVKPEDRTITVVVSVMGTFFIVAAVASLSVKMFNAQKRRAKYSLVEATNEDG